MWLIYGLMGYLVLNTIIWLLRHGIVAKAAKKTLLLRSDYALTTIPLPTVSMVVAARNESANIERCVRSLVNQNYEKLQVIAVNDRSDDDTGAILDRLAKEFPNRLTVVHVKEVLETWLGKPNAMRLGVEQATGEYLCFTDADCDFQCRDTMRIAVQCMADHKVELLSILPVLETPSFWEKVLQPVCSLVLMAWFRPEWVNSPDHPRAYANGAFMMFTRDCYTHIGGHEATRTKVNEDMEFARIVKRQGHRLYVIQNEDLYRTRMYDTLQATYRGWSRIFYGCFAKPGLVLAASAMLMIMSIVPWLTLIASVITAAVTSEATALIAWKLAAFAGAAIVSQLSLVIHFYTMIKLPWIRAFSYPLGASIVWAMLISAVKKFYGGSIVWRGRSIQAGKSAA